MKKPVFTFAIVCAVAFGFTACSGGDDAEGGDDNTEQQMDAIDDEKEDEEPEVEEVSPFGELEGMIGTWTADAATAGVDVSLTFGADGSFNQEMGPVKGEGTWEMVDSEHIKIVTQNTKGQTWLIKNLTESSVDVVWNPDAANPKTLPLKKAE